MARPFDLTRATLAAVLLAAGAAAGCEHIQSHLDPAGPRFAGASAEAPRDPEPALRVVSFNVEFAQHVDRAIEELTHDEALRDADVVLMQEMNVPGIRAVAEALRFHYVYYPATQRGSGGFGNAVLSRWPILEDHKLVLPHPSPANGERRVAVAATLDAPFGPLVVYSLHTETPWMPLHGRRDQWRAVLDDLSARYDPSWPAVIAGDLNTPEHWYQGDLRDTFGRFAFEHASRSAGPTADYFWEFVVLDYVFVRSLLPEETGALATRASDHRPVYVVARPAR